MNTLMRDIRFALRSFVKNPAFALAAVLYWRLGLARARPSSVLRMPCCSALCRIKTQAAW